MPPVIHVQATLNPISSIQRSVAHIGPKSVSHLSDVGRPLWALCGHAAVQRKPQILDRLNVGWQCRSFNCSRLQRIHTSRPLCRNVHGAEIGPLHSPITVANGPLRTFEPRAANGGTEHLVTMAAAVTNYMDRLEAGNWEEHTGLGESQ
jgi:hypothetical protein